MTTPHTPARLVCGCAGCIRFRKGDYKSYCEVKAPLPSFRLDTPAPLAAIRARAERWPEAMLFAHEQTAEFPCLRHAEEPHVSFDTQVGEFIKPLTTRALTDGGAVVEGEVEMRMVNAFCANVGPEMAESIAKAPADIRYLLARLERAEAALRDAKVLLGALGGLHTTQLVRQGRTDGRDDFGPVVREAGDRWADFARRYFEGEA